MYLFITPSVIVFLQFLSFFFFNIKIFCLFTLSNLHLIFFLIYLLFYTFIFFLSFSIFSALVFFFFHTSFLLPHHFYFPSQNENINISLIWSVFKRIPFLWTKILGLLRNSKVVFGQEGRNKEYLLLLKEIRTMSQFH